MTAPDDEVSRELQEVLARAGIRVPASRLAGMVASFADLKAQLPVLRSERGAAAEPAGTYDLGTITRSRPA